MRFSSGEAVFRFWCDYGYAVKNYSMPAVFISEEEDVPPPSINPENCDYPDWWYMWVDIDKIIHKLPDRYHPIIVYYYNEIHDSDDPLAFRLWNMRNEFHKMCDLIFAMLDAKDYKKAKKPRADKYRMYERTHNVLLERAERGEIDMKGIDADLLYTVDEVAALLRYSKATIRRLLREGKLKGYKAVESWRISGEDIINLLKGEE